MRGRTAAAVAVAALVAATAVGLASPTGAVAQPARAAGAAAISWGDCTDPTLLYFESQGLSFQCGYVTVPLDYASPSGGTIKLAVSRMLHTVDAAHYQGVMLVNPGGPGGSGVPYAFLGALVPNGAGAAYDWIGFDPRGVGASVPSLSCDPGYFDPNRPDYVPTTPAIEAQWLGRAAGYAADCADTDAAKTGLLDHMRTTDSAHDMDSIRAALGADRINYYGFSYGTYLGQVYATMFPSHVRRMVLDSNVDPRNVFYQSNLDQDSAFDTVARLWFGWIAKYDDVYHLGTTEAAVESKYYATLDELRAHPLDGFGPAEWSDAFLYSGYVQSLWPDLAAAFAAFVNDGDAAPATNWYRISQGVGDDNTFAVYSAVECTDAPWPTNWNRWDADNWRIYRQHPFLTWGNAWFNAQCHFWPAAADKPFKVDGSAAPPILLLDETLDAATPYEGSLEVRKLFRDSVLVATVGGTSHANSLNGNACVDDTVAAYLADGTLPPARPGNRADLECQPLPEPVPSAAAASAAAAAGSSRTAVLRGALSSLRLRLTAG